ncbi:hypothetical protein So717_19210 [Roseobacter cerasinus]|uniref:MmgE/PrpD family protein n=1 Tax=Roseobacter cerasinus TaxID=2602289 RepID=A0A640VNY7_9RHOB|nr:MmgE/PrpD family protein [Roseobacter cerasinus]GFE50168.1 hypothetical protein So717_19210 [Roseobacter cerasinus]
MGITAQLIAFARSEPDAEALEMMRLSLFDWAVCGCTGAGEAEFAGLRGAALNAGSEATLFGGGLRAAPTAALINGALSHALDFDDTHFDHIGHPSVAIVPAALALAEREQRDFQQFLVACLIGVEASIHVGLWLGRGHYQIGFHQTATAGAFGATLACARLLDLTAEQTAHALGLCASQASGLKAQFGTAGKPLNAGLAARSGVESALWAQAGLTGATEGMDAFCATHHGAGETAYLDRLGQAPWRILRISHKYHACCHGLHAMLEALREMTVPPGEVERLTIRTHPRWMSVCNQQEPTTGLAAKFSYRQAAAMALSGYETGQPGSFTNAVANDPALRQLRGRVEVVPDDGLTETEAMVTLRMSNGAQGEGHHDLAAPLPRELRHSKLLRKAADLLGSQRAKTLWAAVSEDDLTALRQEMQMSEPAEQQP